MIRVHVICEGRTEEMFVKELASQLFNIKNINLFPSLIGRPGHKGGNFKADRLLPDVKERLLNYASSFCTTFFDFYSLPEDFPGRKDSDGQRNIAEKAAFVQTALADYLGRQIAENAMRRFIPYVQMYEFEGLLFSSPEKLAAGIRKPDLAPSFDAIRWQYPTPEDINDYYETAPSRRITRLYPGYRKPLDGLLAAIEIGIDTIRRECRLFDSWLGRLESLSPQE